MKKKVLVAIPQNIYTFVDNDGNNIHIDSEGLRLWCKLNKPEIFWIPLKYDVVGTFLRDNVISLERVKELSTRKKLDPIIMCKDGTFSESNGGPNVMLVDGHHRCFLACLAKLKVIPGYMLEVEQWKPFQLHGLPDVTQEDLIKSPITKRNY